MEAATTAAASRPVLLALIGLNAAGRASVDAVFDVVDAKAPDAVDALVAAHASSIRCVLTNGTVGLDAATIARLPALELVCVLGAGHENIAVEAARARGIPITTGAGANDDCVADHALALLLAVVRQIPRLDRATREGQWRDGLADPPGVSGKRMGIVGLGRIGAKIARRAAAFDCAIGYRNRHALPDSPYRWFESPQALAQWADFLVVAAPGGRGTQHLVDAAVLDALGPSGYLVNIARGSLVDTTALARALDEGRIAGAALDVYESEPAAPAELVGSSRVVLTPHIAGRSPEAVQATVDLFLANAARHFAGEPLLTPL